MSGEYLWINAPHDVFGKKKKKNTRKVHKRTKIYKTEMPQQMALELEIYELVYHTVHDKRFSEMFHDLDNIF